MRRFGMRFLREFAAVTRPDKVFGLVVVIATLLIAYMKYGLTADIRSTAASGGLAIFWAACVFSGYYSIKTAYHLHQEDLEGWQNYKPRIIGGTTPPRPSHWPGSTVSVILCLIFIAAIISTASIARSPQGNHKEQAKAKNDEHNKQAIPPSGGSVSPREVDLGSVDLVLSPHILVDRHRYKISGEEVSGTHYGLSFVLRATNTMNRPRHIRAMRITGEVEADFPSFVSSIEADGLSPEDIEEEFSRYLPYRIIDWIAYPIDIGRLEAFGDERFVRFRFLKPENIGMRAITGEGMDYLGSRSRGTPPRLITKSVHILDIVKFARVSPPPKQELMSPYLRDEVVNGLVRLIVDVDDSQTRIAFKSIAPVKWTLSRNWVTGSAADLFYGATGTSWDRVSEAIVKRPPEPIPTRSR